MSAAAVITARASTIPARPSVIAAHPAVIPAKAGIQGSRPSFKALDSRLRGNDTRHVRR
jgi:hypothetical protein